MNSKKLIECPNCLGTGDMFDPFADNILECTFCNGTGEVSKLKANMYDPVTFQMGSQEDYTIEEEND